MKTHHQPNVVPCLRYADAVRAIDWLCEAFGMVCHMKVMGESDRVEHCQMVMPDGGMVMLGSSDKEGHYGEQIVAPSAFGDRNTQTIYVVVDDVHTHYKQAQAMDVKMLQPLEAKPYGGHGYDCYDLEGHIWSFGDYDPFADS